MPRHTVTMKMGPPTLLDRLWYRSINDAAPVLLAKRPRGERLARLVPYRFRSFHERYAKTHRFFWMPCDLCGYPFGGHEMGKSVPDPTRPPNGYVGICSRCSRERHD